MSNLLRQLLSKSSRGRISPLLSRDKISLFGKYQVFTLATFNQKVLGKPEGYPVILRLRRGRFSSEKQLFSFVEGKTFATAAMGKPEVATENNGPDSDHYVWNNTVTIIRHQLGDERFQMQVTLQNGKIFNFDRKCTDPISGVVARMVTNISKKVKNFDGTVKFLLENTSNVHPNENAPIETILEKAIGQPNRLKLQVGGEVYDVIFNPPEVYAAKFLSFYMPTFPLFPYRMEASSNFCKEKSLYKWEFSREKPSPAIPAKLRKKPVSGSAGDSGESSKWVECGSNLIFTPEQGMESGYLRFTCTPSDGATLGKPFSISLPNPIEPLPVKKMLYEERLSRMNPGKKDGDFLRVLTYNALADCYATPEWFISSPKDSLDAGYRLPILNKEILSYEADLICLQEVDEKYFEGSFEPFLSAQGYKGFHTSKTGNTKEGIATFYNPVKLTSIKFYQTPIVEHMKTLPLWNRLKDAGKGFISRLEERNTVFHLTVFKVNDCPKTILILGNVHLYFHPDADHIRLLQTITCINYLESRLVEVREEFSDHKVSVIYCGDLNCTPPFSSYRLLTTGQIEENDEDWSSHPEEKIIPGISIKHNLNLTNSHPGEELTNITTCFEGCLDYILYQTENFKLLNT